MPENQHEPDLSEIGRKLLWAASEKEKTPGEMLGELFPYVFEASRRMSTRAISAWLKENYGIQISQPTISRALLKPEKYWQAYAETIEPFARIVADATQTTLEGVLADDGAVFDHWLREHVTPNIGGETDDELREALNQFDDAANQLREKWFKLSGQMRSNCRPYLREEAETAEGAQ